MRPIQHVSSGLFGMARTSLFPRRIVRCSARSKASSRSQPLIRGLVGEWVDGCGQENGLCPSQSTTCPHVSVDQTNSCFLLIPVPERHRVGRLPTSERNRLVFCTFSSSSACNCNAAHVICTRDEIAHGETDKDSMAPGISARFGWPTRSAVPLCQSSRRTRRTVPATRPLIHLRDI